jgi:CHAT domain-containing protein/Tfp pilus assembly protein PilF
VLLERWQHQRRGHDQQWRHASTARWAITFCLIALSAVGCEGPSATDWKTSYAVAREKGDRHESAAALEIAEKGFRETASDPVLNYKFRTLYAEFLTPKDWKRSLELMEVPPPTELSSGEFAARQRFVQSLAHIYEGNLHDAESFLEQARKIASSGSPEFLGKIALTEGYLDDVQGRKTAETNYRMALRLAQEYKQLPLQADAQVNIGRLLARNEHYAEAIDQLSTALVQVQALNERLVEEKTLGNLGWSHTQLGNSDQAISFLQKAEEAAAKLDQKTDQQDWYAGLGIAYLSKQDYQAAEARFSAALSLAENLHKKDLVIKALHNLAQLELTRGNLNDAEKYNRRAYVTAGLKTDDRSDPYLVLTTAEIAKGRGQFTEAEDLLKSVVHNTNSNSSLRWQAESDLANVYIAQSKFTDAEQEFEIAIQIVEKASEDVKQEDRRMSILDAWPFYDDYIRFLVDRGNFEKALQIAEFSRARTLAEAFKIKERDDKTGVQVPKLQTSQIQSYLKANHQIILAYWLAEKESYLWAITPAKFQLFRLPAKDQIERAIQFNSGYIDQHRAPEDSPAAQELYEMLVKPAAGLIPKNAHVIIAPNRSLYKLNFETLVVPGAKLHYWIEDVTLQSASSIALLVNSNHRHSQTARRMLLMGAPIEASREFPVLQNAPEEMKRIASRLPAGQGKVVAGKDATPQSYRSSNPGQYKFIHFVTHGTASQMSPLDSAIILSPGVENSYKLYAREIKAIPVHAELVTISACESAGKKTYAGEGLVGLAWAFMRAGAHQVVAALWEVDDASTPQLMDDFYNELGKGKSAVDALHDAKLQMLRSGSLHRPPYYWASLQLYTGS